MDYQHCCWTQNACPLTLSYEAAAALSCLMRNESLPHHFPPICPGAGHNLSYGWESNTTTLITVTPLQLNTASRKVYTQMGLYREPLELLAVLLLYQSDGTCLAWGVRVNTWASLSNWSVCSSHCLVCNCLQERQFFCKWFSLFTKCIKLSSTWL